MSDYPDSIFTPRAVEDREGVEYDADKPKVFFAKDHNDFGSEIVAIETILGLNPEGDFTSVVDRLDDVDNQLEDLEVTDGWKPSSVQPTLIDSDDPIFTLRFSADVTGILSNGMRLKFTQNGSVVYFIIVAVGAYESSNTDILVYGGTDYNVLNTSTYPITSCQYSGEKCPFGFPLDPDLWTVSVSDSNQISKVGPSANIWYNLGSISIDRPVGNWRCVVKVCFGPYNRTSDVADRFLMDVSLSSSSSSESDPDFTQRVLIEDIKDANISSEVSKDVSVLSSDTHYLIARTGSTVPDEIRIRGDILTTKIKLISNYL